MAVSPMYFQVLSPQQANPLGFGMQQGAQTAGNMLQNQLLQAQLPYAGQMAQANLANTQAQAPYINSQTQLNQASLPYMGYKMMAPYMLAQARMSQANTGWSNNLRQWVASPPGQQWMKDNTQGAQSVINALNATAAANNNTASQYGVTQPGSANPFGASAPPAGAQYSSSQPVLPGGNPQNNNMSGMTISPLQAQNLVNLQPPGTVQQQQQINNQQQVAAQQQLKKTTDPYARQRALLASNIDKTLGQINVDDLTRYAGRPFSEYVNRIASPFSGESSNYDNAQTAARNAQLLATQVRQFYGDSIQPSVREELQSLTDPTTWHSNPTLATKLFNTLKTTLTNETSTYRGALQSTAPYQGAPGQSPGSNAMAQPSASKVLNGTTYHKINGQWYAQ